MAPRPPELAPRLSSRLALAFGLLLLGTTAVALLLPAMAGADIMTTKHNLSVNGPGSTHAAPGGTTVVKPKPSTSTSTLPSTSVVPSAAQIAAEKSITSLTISERAVRMTV